MNLIPRSRFYLGDDFFDDFFEPVVREQVKCDVYKKDGNFFIEMDIPGYNKEDINIEVDNGILTVSAETKSEENEEKKDYIRRERRYGKFSRSFNIGEVETDAINAEFNKGTLKISIPEVEEKPTKKQIEIK